MDSADAPLPAHYRTGLHILLRFAAAMALFGLLSGVLFQESSKQLARAEAPGGMHLETLLSLALVHGHVLVSATLIPIAMAAALMLARRAGGAEISPRALAWLTRGYLPCVTLAVLLMLYKGYHVLLSVRFGATDLDAVDASFFGGLTPLRHAVYGVVHVGMALGLGVYCVALWRSLGSRRAS